MKNLSLFILALFVCALSAEEGKPSTLQIVTGAPDGKSSVHREVLDECLELPALKTLLPQSTAKSVYLKNILGNEKDEGFRKLWTARMEISYRLRQIILLVITSNTLEKGKAEIRKETVRTLQQKTLSSEPSESDFFSGINVRDYVFDSREKAEANVKKWVQIWLSSHSEQACKN